ncbi:IQ-domain 11 [Euphorbia peplus]|nr:IQ-domain 11 [Euphorbia peplus]
MAKKRSWFNVVRRFFISEAQDKKDKKRKWLFFGRMKVKNRLPSIPLAPSPPRNRTTTLSEAEEQQSRRALDVALATAAAAEAAVAAAHAAAEVVLLTGVSHSACQCESQVKVDENADNREKKKKQDIAVVKIQSTFRGYLARKALRALKGIVKLQAIIRGRNVRRQAMNTLKCLQSLVNIQSQVSAKRMQIAEGSYCCDENKEFEDVLSDKIIRMDSNSQKRWDGSILTREEAKAVFLSKKEAAVKRERIKEYSFNHRNSAETERNNKANNGRWRYWLEQWVDTQVSKSKELEDLDTILTSNPKPKLEYTSEKHPKHIRNLQNPESESPIIATPRRSFHRKQNSLGEESSFTRSPTTIPTYMASTESAKAKSRSMSSPKLRPASYDAYSDGYSPSKNRLNLMNEIGRNGGRGFGTYQNQQQRSPSLKGISGVPVKSNHAVLKDLSFDSDCSFRTWNHQIRSDFV